MSERGCAAPRRSARGSGRSSARPDRRRARDADRLACVDEHADRRDAWRRCEGHHERQAAVLVERRVRLDDLGGARATTSKSSSASTGPKIPIETSRFSGTAISMSDRPAGSSRASRPSFKLSTSGAESALDVGIAGAAIEAGFGGAAGICCDGGRAARRRRIRSAGAPARRWSRRARERREREEQRSGEQWARSERHDPIQHHAPRRDKSHSWMMTAVPSPMSSPALMACHPSGTGGSVQIEDAVRVDGREVDAAVAARRAEDVVPVGGVERVAALEVLDVRHVAELEGALAAPPRDAVARRRRAWGSSFSPGFSAPSWPCAVGLVALGRALRRPCPCSLAAVLAFGLRGSVARRARASLAVDRDEARRRVGVAADGSTTRSSPSSPRCACCGCGSCRGSWRWSSSDRRGRPGRSRSSVA